VSSALERILGCFVAPAGPAAAAARAVAAAVPVMPEIAVLCDARDASRIASALSLAVARRCRSQAVVTCVWSPGRVPSPRGGRPPARAARRLAERLDAQGLEARACGRRVTVTLPADAPAAAAAAVRAAAAVPGVPAITLLAGPREEAIDRFLAGRDAVAVVPRAGCPPALERAARASLEGLGRPVAVWALDMGPAVRAAAALGIAPAGALAAVSELVPATAGGS
jgi:hypothetical protein